MATERHLFPRLSRIDSEAQWQLVEGLSVSELTDLSATDHEHAKFTATGGVRITPQKLEELQNVIRSVAGRSGFPESPSRSQAAEFDVAAAGVLLEEMGLPPGEAARNGIWSFVGLVLLPDVVRWRFPTAGAERFVGGASLRNALQRLWWRAYVLRDESGQDELRLLRHLSEDALVQIMERSFLSSDKEVAREIAARVLDLQSRLPRGNVEGAVRAAMKWIVCRNQIVSLASLSSDQLRDEIHRIFEGAIQQFAE